MLFGFVIFEKCSAIKNIGFEPYKELL